ncbi:MAG: hypothetical protein N4A37_09785 [Prolixibacteraceae bacterium]|jgi:hypothetical protein|nr:hypothetical protein [Prolixibacteraceae bacterium]
MKITINEVKITDLQGSDIRKAVLQENNLPLDFIEKQLGNYIYSRGSDNIYALGKQIFDKVAITIKEDQKAEFIQLTNECFKGFPTLIPRTIIQAATEPNE